MSRIPGSPESRSHRAPVRQRLSPTLRAAEPQAPGCTARPRLEQQWPSARQAPLCTLDPSRHTPSTQRQGGKAAARRREMRRRDGCGAKCGASKSRAAGVHPAPGRGTTQPAAPTRPSRGDPPTCPTPRRSGLVRLSPPSRSTPSSQSGSGCNDASAGHSESAVAAWGADDQCPPSGGTASGSVPASVPAVPAISVVCVARSDVPEASVAATATPSASSDEGARAQANPSQPKPTHANPRPPAVAGGPPEAAHAVSVGSAGGIERTGGSEASVAAAAAPPVSSESLNSDIAPTLRGSDTLGASTCDGGQQVWTSLLPSSKMELVPVIEGAHAMLTPAIGDMRRGGEAAQGAADWGHGLVGRAAMREQASRGAHGRSWAAMGVRVGPASNARPSASATAVQVERARAETYRPARTHPCRPRPPWARFASPTSQSEVPVGTRE